MAKAHSTRPAKPHKDFPLFPHARGYWAKKVKGKLHYFGRWDDPEGSLAEWMRHKEAILLTGNRDAIDDRVAVVDVCDKYLIAKNDLVESGEVSFQHWTEIKRIAERIIQVIGKETRVEDVKPADFARLRAEISKKYGIHRTAKEIQITRSIFKYAFESGLVDRQVRFGTDFKKPSKRLFRIQKAKTSKLLVPAEILKLIEQSSCNLAGMIWLGINAGFNNEDCCQLPIKAVDLKSGWLNWYRPKTGIQRRVFLWPETRAAIDDSLTLRPNHKSDCLFITKYRNPWASDAVGHEFRKVAESCKLDRDGLTFTSLRHTFQTIGEESGDYLATRSIMGHVDDSISATYRERFSDDRLRKVTAHVRKWLLAGKPKAKKNGGEQVAKSPKERRGALP